MDIFQAFTIVAAHGVALLSACHERSAYDIVAAGVSLEQAKTYKRTATAFLGPADSPKVQQDTLAVATAQGLSIERLTMINRHANRLTRRGQAWKLRAELVAMTGSFEEVNAHGKARVEEILGPQPKQPGVRIGRTKNGMRTMTITDSQRRITDFEKTLDAVTDAREAKAREAKSREADAPEPPVAQKRSNQLLTSLWEHLESDSGLVAPSYRTVIAIGLDECTKILRGEGDDVIVGLSDGTTMTGAEVLGSLLAGELGHEVFAGLFHPVAGPVNLYHARFASMKQRVLAMAENLVCPWPDCSVPADRCQVHHLQPHNLGGPTVPWNMTMLCKYHNGVNDDNSSAPPKNGRMERCRGTPPGGSTPDGRSQEGRHRGKVRYRSRGGRLFANTHINSSLGAMNLI